MGSLRRGLDFLRRGNFISYSKTDNVTKLRLEQNGVILSQNLLTFVKRTLPQSLTNSSDCATKSLSIAKQEFFLDNEERLVFDIEDNGDCVFQSAAFNGEKLNLIQEQEFLRTRRRLWKRLLTDPWSINILEDRSNENTSSTVSLSLKEHYENLSCSFELERHSFTDKSIETRIQPKACSMAVLLESFRFPSFSSDRERLSLHPVISPFPVAVIITEPPSSPRHSMLLELQDYIVELAAKEGVHVSTQIPDFETADLMGVAGSLVLSDIMTLGYGVVRVRDRESSWFEEVHVAHLINRIKHICKTDNLLGKE